MAENTTTQITSTALERISTNGLQLLTQMGNLISALTNPPGVASTGGVTSSSATAGMGYTTGAGGTQTQATSKSTTVVLNKVTGAITMNNAALNAGIEVSFTLTNSTIAAADVVLVNHSSAGTAGAYMVQANSIAAGSCAITVTNLTAGNLSEAIVLSFVVIKGATA
mgnify:CR=1 FL=1